MGEESWILNVVGGGAVAVAVALSPSLDTTLTTDTSRRFDEGAEESPPPVRALSAFLMDFISSSHSITSDRDFSIASRALSVMVASACFVFFVVVWVCVGL
jgi:hypothetical protein